MALVKLKQNQVGPWSNSGSIFTAFEWGTAFRITADRYLRTLDWGRIQVGAGDKPTTLRLWDVATGTVKYSAPTIPDNGAVGLQTHEVTTEVHLPAGFEGVISTAFPGGAAFGYIDADPVPPPVPFEYLSPDTRYAAPTGYPSLTPGDTTWHVWHDIGLDVYPPVTLVPTVAVLEEQLESWLSQSQGTRPTDSFPELNHVLLTAIQTAMATVPAEHASVLAAVAAGGGVTAIGRLATILGLLEGATGIAANVASIYSSLTQDGAYEDIGVDVANLWANALIVQGKRNIPVGGSGWLLQDSTSGSGKVAWNSPADAYVLTRTGWDADRQVNVYEGVTYFFDRGWWAPLDGGRADGYATLASEKHILRVGDRRLPGVLIVQDDDFEWDLDAWQYVGSGA